MTLLVLPNIKTFTPKDMKLIFLVEFFLVYITMYKNYELSVSFRCAEVEKIRIWQFDLVPRAHVRQQ